MVGWWFSRKYIPHFDVLKMSLRDNQIINIRIIMASSPSMAIKKEQTHTQKKMRKKMKSIQGKSQEN